MKRAPLLVLSLAAVLSHTPVRAETTIPDENRASLQAPPPRPSAEGAQALGARLFEAIVTDRPELAASEFFPEDAFLVVKAMAQPERYYRRLAARFVADVHALHRTVGKPEGASFVRLDLGRRGGWVRPGDEGNRLPYWAARHATLHYLRDGRPKTLEVRVLISWGPRWYVIHLSEFQAPTK